MRVAEYPTARIVSRDMRQRFAIDRDDPRVVLRVGGQRVLLDTLARRSHGRGQTLALVGQPCTFPDDEAALAAYGAAIDAVMGCDLIARWYLLVDRRNGFAVASAVPVVLGEAPEALDTTSGWLVVEASLGATPVRALLASGARLSYADPAAVAQRPAAGSGREAHPLLGGFETPLHALALGLGEQAIEGPFGVLPVAALERLASADAPWVIGCELFAEGPVLLDLAGATISFAGD